MKILLIEDEYEMATAIRDALASFNIVLDHADSVRIGLRLCQDSLADVIVVDRQLPDGDGLEIVAALRGRGDQTPVLVLTALGELAERVEGLDVGADDYLAKPFAIEELVARLRALMRRPKLLSADLITVGALEYDFSSYAAIVRGVPLDLKRRELLVLEALVKRFGRMVTRESLMTSAFSIDDEVLPNALDTSVSRLRRKLLEADAGLTISVVRGLGFMLRESS